MLRNFVICGIKYIMLFRQEFDMLKFIRKKLNKYRLHKQFMKIQKWQNEMYDFKMKKEVN